MPLSHAHGEGSLSELVPLAVTAAAFLIGLGLMEHERARASGTSAPIVRWLTVTLLYVASIAHVPVIPAHLAEAPHMGFLFIAFALVAFGLAVALVYRPSSALNLIAGVLCAAGVCAYVATRLVAFPLLADDVGNWAEPFGARVHRRRDRGGGVGRRHDAVASWERSRRALAMTWTW